MTTSPDRPAAASPEVRARAERVLAADPTALVIQDGDTPYDYVAREVFDEEKRIWWERAAAVYPPYDEYQAATDRIIPVMVASRA